jgi:L-alanine-DL-glutamate epimerase-like enolase superfamily enzyme
LRLPALAKARVAWIEEPFAADDYASHAELAHRARGESTRLAGGEGAHTSMMATNLIDYGGVSYIQIDTGRIGGIGSAVTVAEHAVRAGVQYVNHTFTTHLALSASLQPFAGLATHSICEYPVDASPLAHIVVSNPLIPDEGGMVRAPEAPGLGMELDLEAMVPYLHDVRIAIDGVPLFASPRAHNVTLAKGGAPAPRRAGVEE